MGIMKRMIRRFVISMLILVAVFTLVSIVIPDAVNVIVPVLMIGWIVFNAWKMYTDYDTVLSIDGEFLVVDHGLMVWRVPLSAITRLVIDADYGTMLTTSVEYEVSVTSKAKPKSSRRKAPITSTKRYQQGHAEVLAEVARISEVPLPRAWQKRLQA